MYLFRSLLLKLFNPEYFELLSAYEHLQGQYSLLSRYMDPQVLNYQVNNAFHTDGEIKDLCVLFTDVRGFTKFSEKASLPAANSFLNNFYDIVIHHTRANGGVVDKLIGDGTMSIFGAFDDDEEDYTLKCIAAAKGIQQDFIQMISQEDEPSVNLGVGIAKGKALLGAYGNGEFVNFTAIGHTVNLAARLQGQAKNNEIFTVKPVTQYLHPDQYTSAGRFQLKNVSKTVEIFEVL